MTKHQHPDFASRGADAAPKHQATRSGLMASKATPSAPEGADASFGTGDFAFAPVLLPAEDAFAALGIGRTKGFALIREGHLAARKVGTRTLVEVESIHSFVAGLPRAGERA
jgi:hypothetical protein